MKLNTALATLAVVSATVLPLAASAQYKSKDKKNDDRYQSRDKKKNQKDTRYESKKDDSRYDSKRDNRWNDNRKSESDRRQDTKNEWRNIAIGSGLVGVLGLLKHDNTLTFAGAAGALYSLDRYEKDRKSQNAQDRGRSSYFSRDHFTRDGVRYDRKTVTKNGQRYYQFTRSR
ncbi:hypothetical protein EON81_11170 [bacterium]|nr:MAG: hypothetical protein EON81_11170 [bacterium]